MLASHFENPEPGAIPEEYEDSFGVSGRPDPLSHSAYPRCGVNPEAKDAGRGIIGNLSSSCHCDNALPPPPPPPSASVGAKLGGLPVAQEYEYAKADGMASIHVNFPTRFDAEVASCIVHGTISPDLDGTFYRVICDSTYANRIGKDTWINGDGAIDAWRISNAVCDFKQKFVLTHSLATRGFPKWFNLLGTHTSTFGKEFFLRLKRTVHLLLWTSNYLAADSRPDNRASEESLE
ncbi:hypothetical protein V2G26_015437 [Clonostachys chloroleuca]